METFSNKKPLTYSEAQKFSERISNADLNELCSIEKELHVYDYGTHGNFKNMLKLLCEARLAELEKL